MNQSNVGAFSAKKWAGIAVIAVALVVMASAYSLPAFGGAAESDSQSVNPAAQRAWPEMPSEADTHFWQEFGEEMRGVAGEGPGRYTFDFGKDVATIALTLRYGEYRVGTALPWLRSQSKDLWSSPAGIAACFALLYFNDVSGFKRIQANIEQISRSPEHWNALGACLNGNTSVFYPHLYDLGDADEARQLTLRTISRLPASDTLKAAFAQCSDEQLALIVAGLDETAAIEH